MSNAFSGRARVPEHVVDRTFGDQTVLLNLDTGQYHGLNRTGGRILELVRETGDLSVVAARMAEEYGREEPEMSADLVELCALLSARGLLEVDDTNT